MIGSRIALGCGKRTGQRGQPFPSGSSKPAAEWIVHIAAWSRSAGRPASSAMQRASAIWPACRSMTSLKRVSIRVDTIWERDSLFSFEVPASGARGFFALFSRSGSKAQSGSPVSNTDRRPESRFRVSPWGIQFAQLPAVEVADAAGWAAAGGPGVRSR